MAVFVLDKRRKPLMPCTEKRARLLLERKRGVVHRRYPFTLRLKDRIGGEVQPVRLKIDPGAETTGIAIVREEGANQHVLHLAEIKHRGKTVRKHMRQRAAFRRRRRSANLRYRAPRFHNRRRKQGWLPPSLKSRWQNMTAWVGRFQRLAPLSFLSVEHVRFDMQKMACPEISGVAYQRGDLAGYEVREYLLEKWQRQCAYCGIERVPLQVEHIQPKRHGGTNRVANLTLACEKCNQAKGSRSVEEFLAKKPELLARLRTRAKTPLDAAAAVNTVRWALVGALRAMSLPLELGSGGQTKWNRIRLGMPKTHSLDAACVGVVEKVHDWNRPVLVIGCTGHGSYQRTRLTAHGLPRGYLTRKKWMHGFRTGDLVRATVPSGKKAGVYTGRVAVRSTGNFNIRTREGVIQGIQARYCSLLCRADGYSYHTEGRGDISSHG